MSKKQWFVLTCLYITYILLGASFYYHVQSEDEHKKRLIQKEERREIEALLYKHYVPSLDSTQEDIFGKLREYCGKPMTVDEEVPIIWDFFHSLFFVITVVTTVGYGNIAPTTMLGRIFMIFYALIGIPLNGMVMVTLGEYFAKSFRKLYTRWKSTKMHYHASKLGLIGQVILYLIPGFTFFIFIPSVVIMIFEQWDYDVAVYYAFVTLTTIGFGDYVPTYQDNDFNRIAFTIYKIFLLIWIMIGLGYGIMIIGFISSGLRSKRMRHIEHVLSDRLKQTPNRIRALRTLVHEILLMRVKPVYKQPFSYTPTLRDRSQSCPDLSLYRDMDSPTMVRKRALSAVEVPPEGELLRVQSDTDLSRIDMDLTFQREHNEQNELLRRVANALGNYESIRSSENALTVNGIDGFSDEDILASEWSSMEHRTREASPSPGFLAPSVSRKRAASEVKFPFGQQQDIVNQDLTWYGTSATKKLQEIREIQKHGRARSRTLPSQQLIDSGASSPGSRNIFNRIKKSFTREDKATNLIDVERQQPSRQLPIRRNRAFSVAPDTYLQQTRHGRISTHSVRDEPILEDTIAELLVALTAPLTSTSAINNLPKQRKMGTASLTPPQAGSPSFSRRLPIRAPFPTSRRSSLMPTSAWNPNVLSGNPARRSSLMPIDSLIPSSNLLAPPPYSVRPLRGDFGRMSLRKQRLDERLRVSPNVTRRIKQMQQQRQQAKVVIKVKGEDDQKDEEKK